MRVPLKPRPHEQGIHRTDSSARRTAAPWPGREADREISFEDIKALPDPDWIGRNPEGAYALDAELLEPLPLADWAMWLDAEWFGVSKSWSQLAVRTTAELTGLERDWGVAACMLTAPFIAECEAFEAELKAQVA